MNGKTVNLKKQAQNLASMGRYGDTMLVHMHPAEVAGIASITPGGLTTNPDTGQPEMWASLIPLLTSGISSLAGWSPWASALLSGAATTALTDDWKRGLSSGIMSFGLGSAMNAGIEGATEAGAGATLGKVASPSGDKAMLLADPKELGFMDRAKALFGTPEGRGAFMEGLSDRKNFLPIVVGGGTLEDLEQQEEIEKQISRREPSRFNANEDLANAYRAVGQTYGSAPTMPRRSVPYNPAMFMPGMAEGGEVPYGDYPELNVGDMTDEEVDVFLKAFNASDGKGLFGKQGDAKTAVMRFRAEQALKQGAFFNLRNKVKARAERMDEASGYAEGGEVSLYGGMDPAMVQASLRGAYSIAPPMDFTAGFNPEFMYFQNPGQEGAWAPPYVPPWMSTNHLYSPYINQFAFQPPQPYFNSFWPSQQQMDEQDEIWRNRRVYNTPGMAEGGTVPLNTSMGQMNVAPGGVANLPTEFSQPSEEAIQQVAMAILGQVPEEQANMIVNEFVQTYGPEAFEAVREMILSQGNPNTQTQGMVQGPGGGMDDMVQGTIGNQQPVAVSPGEYIVPADVVSGLGDGSSDAGAAELDRMSDNVRMAKTGGRVQPAPLDKRVMPA